MYKDEHTEQLNFLQKLEGKPYDYYQRLSGKTFNYDCFHLSFIHVQGSPGAFPASVCHLHIEIEEIGLEKRCFASKPRQLATADFLLRSFQRAVINHTLPNRGVQGSGSFQPLTLPPQVLERNVVSFSQRKMQLAFLVSLPASQTNTVLGSQACHMFGEEICAIVDAIKKDISSAAELTQHCDVIEDMLVVQDQLNEYGLVGFVGDGAILPRKSGVSQAPLEQDAVKFYAPEEMAIELDFPNAGRIRGLGVRAGINVLIGAGFHGKSTFLDALAKGIYPHIPGDGREKVITNPDAVVICTEAGRSVKNLDISGFINNLPGKVDVKQFTTENASGSTSEAAAIMESILAGAKLLLIDEDSSAINFLIKDQHMRKLLPEETITPLFDRVREMYQSYGVSTLISIGGSSDYLGAADQVIGMRNYLPVSISEKLDSLDLPKPQETDTPLILTDNRHVLADNFDPSYFAQRFNKNMNVRIKTLRLQDKILEYGNETIELTSLAALVDPGQTLALGYALLMARQLVNKAQRSPSQLAAEICRCIENSGLKVISEQANIPLFLAEPRKLEVAAAINRMRSLRVMIQK